MNRVIRDKRSKLKNKPVTEGVDTGFCLGLPCFCFAFLEKGE